MAGKLLETCRIHTNCFKIRYHLYILGSWDPILKPDNFKRGIILVVKKLARNQLILPAAKLFLARFIQSRLLHCSLKVCLCTWFEAEPSLSLPFAVTAAAEPADEDQPRPAAQDHGGGGAGQGAHRAEGGAGGVPADSRAGDEQAADRDRETEGETAGRAQPQRRGAQGNEICLSSPGSVCQQGSAIQANLEKQKKSNIKK